MKLLQQISETLKGGYRFPDGSRLLSDGRDGKIYVAPDGRRVAFQCELWDAAAGTERCIYESTISRWVPPHDDEPFGEADRREVIKKTCLFFEATKTTYVVQ
jgi:peptidoglycan/xylan/chitin deacetylase (PgdA/CDA1 family)